MLRPLTLLTCLLLLLAGCVAKTPDEPATPAGAESPDATDRLVAHGQAGPLDVPDAWSELDVRTMDTGYHGGEPTLGVAADGTMFVAGALHETVPVSLVLRSRDHGQTWDAIHDPAWTSKMDMDPWLWLDPATDRVFHAPLYAGCSWLAWSDDQGETWAGSPAAGCPPTSHDHQKLTTGPPPEGVQTDGYPSIVYYAYNSALVAGTPVRLGTLASVSYDGGLTWSQGQVVHENDDCHSGLNGPIAVGPEGTAYLPKPTCEGVDVSVSRDGGATWEEPVGVNGAGDLDVFGFDPDIDTDAAGHAYLVFPGDDGRTYLSMSRDQGGSWSAPVAASPPGVNMTTFTVVSAGDEGRVAIGYLGTRANVVTPEQAPPETTWHLYLTFTEDAGAEDPTFVTVQVTPEDDPVQRGCIWLSGGKNPCRNLLDFIDMVEHDGRAYVSYTDGCLDCPEGEQSTDRQVHLAIVDAGPSLRQGTLAPLAE